MQSTRQQAVTAAAGRRDTLLRGVIFAFLAVLLCPFRYFDLFQENVLDSSWLYAMNLAALRGLRYGVDVIWTTGPLAYLFQPLDMGNHLSHGLVAQAVVWLVLLGIAAEVSFLAAVPLWNLFAFALCVAAAAPLFHFNYMGVENLLLLAILVSAALLLLRPFRWARYGLLLALAPPIFLIKGTGAAIALGVIAGLIVVLAARHQWRRALTASALALVLLPALTLLAFRFSAGSWAILPYLQGLVDVSSEYSVLMAVDGPPDEQIRALVVFSAFVGIQWMAYARRQAHWILCVPFAAPLLVALKHGFVRQDVHVINFFCLVLLLLGVFLLFIESWRFDRNFPLLLMLLIAVSVQSVQWRLGGDYWAEVSGRRNLEFLAGVIDLPETKRILAEKKPTAYGRDFPLDESVSQAIGRHSVGFLSPLMVQAPWHGLNLMPMPVPQGYQCSRKLDGVNAGWLARQGPDKLLLEWFGVDGRHPLGENPATLLETYRWYETEQTEPSRLLLRRRTSPRGVELVPLRAETLDATKEIAIPDAPGPVFLRIGFDLTTAGKAAKLFYHVPRVDMTISPPVGAATSYRVILESLEAPLLVSHLPTDLDSAARLFTGPAPQNPKQSRLTFSGPGLPYYQKLCKVEFLTVR
jgi:hypothetical protein